MDDAMDVNFRFLGPDEGGVLTEAIEAAYGTTYDVRWVYDRSEVSARLADGRYVSCVAESADGALLCHMGMSLAAAGDAVAHSGQAVTLEAARGQHLFTRTKRFLMDWAREEGLAGMFSEATAAHPYSQRANIELGAHETGFLLGWIPATVANDAAAGAPRRRQSAALFYTKLNDGQERRVYAPERHHEIVGQTLALCELRGTLAKAGPDAELAGRSELHVAVDEDRNLALFTGHVPGAGAGRRRSRAAGGLLCRGLPQSPHRRRRAADAVAAPGPSQGRRHCRRLGPRSRAIGLRPVLPAVALGSDVSGGEVRTDLALDPLQGVVDGLGVALQLLGDHLVGVAVEVEREDAALEIGEDAGGGGEAGDQAGELFGGDHLVDRVVDAGAGQDLVQGRVRVPGGGVGLAERASRVERRVLVAGRGLGRR